MASTRFNANILAAARKLKDKRVSPTSSDDSGKRYTSTVLAYYQNRAIAGMVKEAHSQFGDKIGEYLPQVVKRTGVLGFTSGHLKTPEEWRFIELVTSDGLTVFNRISGDIIKIISGRDPVIQPSEDHPVFWEEGLFLWVYPTQKAGADWSVEGRYIVNPAAVSVSVSPAGSGKPLVADPFFQFNVASGYMIGIEDGAFAVSPADVGKKLFFIDSASNIWCGEISSIISANVVHLRGNGLPSVNKGPGLGLDTILSAMIPDITDVQADVILPEIFDGDIVEKMVSMGLQDAMQDAK